MPRTIRWESWPADTLYICLTHSPPTATTAIQARWEASEIEVISPEADEEMLFSHLDDEHDRVLFVWWD